MYNNYQRGYSNQRYYNQRQYNQNYNQKPKKRSGCKSVVTKNGDTVIVGWNFSKRYGLISFIAGANKKTKTFQGRTKDWQNWTIKVSPKNQQPYLLNCLYNVTDNKVIVKDLGIVLNPKTNYCGTFTRK